MKAGTILTSIALVVFVIVQGASSQWDEICHWQCDVIHCDYYGDYCDYDCYEVCYPYAARNQNRHLAPTVGRINVPLETQHLSSLSVKGGQVVIQHPTKQQESESTGKTVRMRIESPTFQSVQRGRVVATRRSNPKSFALMQTCLSNQLNKQSSAPISPLGAKHNGAVIA